MDKPVEWLYNYFSAKGEIPGKKKEDQIAIDFFDAALIDSFGLIVFIADIEAEFSIKFGSDDLQNEEFRTIKGLAKIIGKKIRAKNG